MFTCEKFLKEKEAAVEAATKAVTEMLAAAEYNTKKTKKCNKN